MPLNLAWLQSLSQDLRLAVRSLRKSPGFLAVVVLSLAVAIGANSTIFSVIDALLYRPLPYSHPEQLTVILENQRTHPDAQQPPPIAESLDWKKQNHVFQDIALTSLGGEDAVLSGAGQPQRIAVQNVTPNFFALLGAQPILGRVSLPAEMQDNSQTVVISYAFWKTHFNSDPHVLGKTFQLSGIVSTVVGVMPKNFQSFYGDNIALWQPIDAESKRYADRADHWLIPIARLKPSATLAQAKAEMDAIAYRLEQQYPTTNKGAGTSVLPLRELLFGWARQALYPLFGAVAFVLLIACANVANLLQSRTEMRRGEYAVRLSLGAGRWRLVQESLVESTVLGLLGGAIGLLLAYGGIRLFLSLAGSDFPDADSIAINFRVVLFTLSISLFTTVLFGLMPAFQVSNPDLNTALRDGARLPTSRSRGFVRQFLPVIEVALAMVLLVGTGLMINTMLRLRVVNPGFDTKNLLAVSIALPEGGKYVQRVGADMEKATLASTSFYQQLLERVSALPGVESAGLISGLPTHFSEGLTFTIVGQPAPPPDRRPQAGYCQVSPSFFHALKLSLKNGRYLDDHDTEAAPWAAVINEAFVRRYFPKEDPIGKQIRLRYDPYPTEEYRPRQIVGVVGDIKHYGLSRPAPPFIYASYLQQPSVYPGGSIVAHLWQDLTIRTAPGGEPGDLAKAIRQVVQELDPDQPISGITSMDRLLTLSLGEPRFYTQILVVFGVVAAFLAGMGIYGVMSYFVSRHTHDIGVRMALGAHRSDILRWVAKLGFKLISTGILVGIALGLGLTRLLSAFLFGVKPTDPLTYVAAALCLSVLAALACYIPARRAAKVDPLVALRYQ